MTMKVLEFKTEFQGVGDGAKAVDWVKVCAIGGTFVAATWHRIKDLQPKEGGLRDDNTGEKTAIQNNRWAAIEPHYKAWKDGIQIAETGTPIQSWPGITESVCQAFVRAGVKTVEDVASLPDSTLSKISIPDARKLVKQANVFLSGIDTAKAAEEMVTRDEKIAALEEQLAAATELLEEAVKGKGKKEAA